MTQHNAFRPLNENEINAMVKLNLEMFRQYVETANMYDSALLDDFHVSYESISDGVRSRTDSNVLHGSFTICLLVHSSGLVWRGCSHRSYRDKPNHLKGDALAFNCALASKPVSIPGYIPSSKIAAFKDEVAKLTL